MGPKHINRIREAVCGEHAAFKLFWALREGSSHFSPYTQKKTQKRQYKTKKQTTQESTVVFRMRGFRAVCPLWLDENVAADREARGNLGQEPTAPERRGRESVYSCLVSQKLGWGWWGCLRGAELTDLALGSLRRLKERSPSNLFIPTSVLDA